MCITPHLGRRNLSLLYWEGVSSTCTSTKPFTTCRYDHWSVHWQVQVQRSECEEQGASFVGGPRQLWLAESDRLLQRHKLPEHALMTSSSDQRSPSHIGCFTKGSPPSLPPCPTFGKGGLPELRAARHLLALVQTRWWGSQCLLQRSHCRLFFIFGIWEFCLFLYRQSKTITVIAGLRRR